nr:hypothetical protein CFP56_52580 [Quercus suber]
MLCNVDPLTSRLVRLIRNDRVIVAHVKSGSCCGRKAVVAVSMTLVTLDSRGLSRHRAICRMIDERALAVPYGSDLLAEQSNQVGVAFIERRSGDYGLNNSPKE